MKQLSTMLALLLCFVLCQCTQNTDADNSSYNEYVAAYTTGSISRQSNICIVFSQDIRQSRIDSLKLNDIVKLSPAIDGQCVFTDNHTLVFTPQNGLQRNTRYTVSVDIESIFDAGGQFDFAFTTKPLNIRASFKTLNVATDDSYEAVFTISTTDIEQPEFIEKHIAVSVPCETIWEHAANGYIHTLTAKFKPTAEVELKISTIDDKGVGLTSEEIECKKLPSPKQLTVVDITTVQGDSKCVEVTFNKILDAKQDINGLAIIKEQKCSASVSGNKIKIYPENALQSDKSFDVLLNPAIKSKDGIPLGQDITRSITFDKREPAVEFIGSGSIIPQSDRILVPFRSIYMRGVRVMVFKIFNNMVGTLLQHGQIDDYSNLAFAGRPVAATTFYMDESGEDLSQWHTFAVDLTKQFELEPGAIYRVELSLDARLSAWPCDSLPTATKEEIAAEDHMLLARMNADFDENNYYYTGKAYYSYNWYDGYYRDRQNPSAKCYYDDKTIGKNLLATNIGLTAFNGNDNKLHVSALRLQDAGPLSGVDVEAYSMQQQLLGKATTNSDGIAIIETNEALGKPRYIVARKGNNVSYLKVQRGTELSTSSFEVGGDVVQNGLKGYIYGDRGVWRPGDTMYLSFMLNDRNKTLPTNHPISVQITNPLGQVVQNITRNNGLMGTYSFNVPLSTDAPTGIWTAKVSVGNVSFSKNLRVETIKPNRLKIDLKLPEKLDNTAANVALHTEWLNGNIASGLKYDISATIVETKTTWKNWKGYVFDNPTKSFETTEQNVAKGEVGATGNASVTLKLNTNNTAPGMLKCNLTTMVYEPSGEFSTDASQVLVSPYSRYVGVKSPLNEKQSHLDTDKNQKFDVVSVDKDGKSLPYVNLTVKVFKVDWYWWWRADKNEMLGYTSSQYNAPVKTMKVQTNADGKGTFDLNVSESNWGTYLIEVADADGGHSTGILSYFDWPWMKTRRGSSDRENATVLTVNTDKKEYEVGDKMHISIPSNENSTAILCISNGTRILKFETYPCQKDVTNIDVEVTNEMMPNAYVSVSLVKKYGDTNYEPMRLYGIAPITVTSAQSILNPIISATDEVKPESKYKVTVSEKDGRPMAYTLAIVDEGLLDLTHFRTPNAWNAFNAHEAMGVRMWDLYDNINGAYSGRIDQTFSIGGDEALNNGPKAIVNRFTPMVYFAGPFALKKGQKRSHDIDVPNYNGRVRVMVVAGDGEAYGNAEKSVVVRRPLMLIGTMPRQIGVNDEMMVSATIFASKRIGNVDVSLAVSNELQIIGTKNQKINFDASGDKTVQFKVKALSKSGVGKVTLKAVSSDDKVDYPIEIDIRSISQNISKTTSVRVEAGQTFEQNISIPGDEKYRIALEVSGNQPLNITNRLNSLLVYPHGCVEQITSKMFPQIFLADFSQLSEQQIAEIENNVKTGIDRLRNYQTTDGGMAYWPGGSYGNIWASAYVLNFLTEASNHGYYVPEDMLRSLKKFVKINLRKLKVNTNQSEIFDACYSLYVLAKAQDAELGVMNVIKENVANIDKSSQYLLSASYALVSRTDVAQQLLNASTNNNSSYWCSNAVTKLIAQTLCNDKNASEVAEEVRKNLMSDQWLSTSEIAHSLIAMSAYYKKNASSDGIKFSAIVDGKKIADVDSKKYVWTTSANQTKNSAKVTVKNNGRSVIYLDLTANGVATQSHVDKHNNGFDLSVKYLSDNGTAIDVANIEQSSTFKAIVSIQNTSGADIQHVALTHIVPAGWEVLSTSTNGNVSYQDKRDDRVLSYIDTFRAGDVVNITLNMSATYAGTYYLPSIYAEAMYDATISGCTASGSCIVK